MASSTLHAFPTTSFAHSSARCLGQRSYAPISAAPHHAPTARRNTKRAPERQVRAKPAPKPRAKAQAEKAPYKMKYKTEICHYWQVNGWCKFGNEVGPSD